MFGSCVCVFGQGTKRTVTCVVGFVFWPDACTDIPISVLVEVVCRWEARVADGRYINDVHTASSGHLSFLLEVL